MKKLLTLAFVLILALSLVACGQSSSDEKLVVASTPTGPPYTYMNSENNQMEGIMVDIIKELGKRIGKDVEVKPMQFSTLIPALQEGKVDVISAGMITTEERKKVVDFTNPVFGFGEGLVVQENDKSTKTLEDLKGKKIGVQLGTSYQEHVKKEKITNQVIVYKAIGEMLKDLDNKRLDGVVADKPVIDYLKKQNPNFKIRIVEDYQPNVVGKVGIGVAKDNKALLDQMNKEIEKMQQDGSLDKIYKKWEVDWK